MSDTNEHWVACVLELHLNAHFSVADHQPSVRVLCFQLQHPCQSQWPALTTQGVSMGTSCMHVQENGLGIVCDGLVQFVRGVLWWVAVTIHQG